MKRIYCARHVIVEGETSNAREKEAESATIMDKPIVIIIGKKKVSSEQGRVDLRRKRPR